MNADQMVSDHHEDVTVEASTSLVVGYDGSAGADQALKVALQLASDLGAPVTIVRAWSIMTAPRPAGWTFGYVPSVDELAGAVRAELVKQARGHVARFPDVKVTYREYGAGPAKSLIKASRDARMLVVGTRGLGGFSERVLGSVSDQCVRHAHCPVLVTRLPAKAAHQDR